MDRRSFLESSAAAGVATAISAAAAKTASAANEKISIGMVGVRGRGASVLSTFASLPDVEVRYVGDLDEPVRQSRIAAVEQRTGKRPIGLKDYRKALEDKSLDALVLATPDHWHALPTIHACQAGKDVYVEKPASHNIWEGRQMVKAARKYNRVVQVGTQTRSGDYTQAAVEYIRSGKLGHVYLVRVINMKEWPDLGHAVDGPT